MLAALRSRALSLSSSSSSSAGQQWKLGFLGLNRSLCSSVVENYTNKSDNNGLLSLEEIEKVLGDVKADDVKVIPVKKRCDWADFMVVATGRSAWHVRNIAEALIYKVKQKQKGAKRMLLPSVEGQEGGKWIVIDSGTVIIHALDEKVRAYYNLERLWTTDSSDNEHSQDLDKALVKHWSSHVKASRSNKFLRTPYIQDHYDVIMKFVVFKLGRRTKTSRKKIKITKPRRELHNPAAIKSLPGDLLIEVLGRVASSSFTDLFNAKLCCRDFLGLAEDDYILQHVSIDKFPVIPWFTSGEAISFINRCKESGNPEALFRQGMVEYFSFKNVESGLESLKKAAEKGHAEASYVYEIILLCSEGGSNQESFELLNAVKSSKSASLRRSIKAMFQSMWVKNNNIMPQHHSCCNANGCIIELGGRWDRDEDKVVCCDACRRDQEVVSFCNMLQGRDI
ncbi:hypothetical protein F0562_034167 [Nyssa sinensis]|uniref:At2g35280-like TPR domain-containing protein n=1 Tax=Nyssa sinensis TaxID=561372 RepID=A0A5J5AFG2_9ASTE|nr:hypothetical protein F0562_034167 [Nyssa sinensis]